ncbi:MAG: type II toxin-antitoxin system RelE/ParE family toxin [Cyclobacteriaceae bacterium]|nr:type II toxin-antitoxin system RelE/ParE family toxin [Cyclobacteriaceae bacterium]
MNYSLLLSLDAQQDILDSIAFYNLEKENLGFEFYDRVIEKLTPITNNPHHYAVRFGDIRTSMVARFPYLIYFRVKKVKSIIIVLGILHTSRNPQIIKKRK